MTIHERLSAGMPSSRSAIRLFLMAIAATMLTASFACAAAEPAATPRKGPLRIVCLGDSITQGFGLVDAEGKQAMNKLGYPAKLGALLGPQARVNVYGAGGTTYFRNGMHPFGKTAWATYVKNWKPDIVTLAFGTNCSNDKTWPKHSGEYAADVRWLINEVRNLCPGVTIYTIHPNEDGMKLIAATIADCLYATRKDLSRPAEAQSAK